MNAFKENTDVIHRIDLKNSQEISTRFDELVDLLEGGTDENVKLHLQGFHHSTWQMRLDCFPKVSFPAA